MLSADEYAKLLKSAFTPTTALAESGKPDTCLMSSSYKWVIDSRVTDHMTSNSSLFTTFHSHPTASIVTLENGSKSCVLRSGTINPTPLIPLTYVLSLPHFSFNSIYVSKLTQTLNCSISFFPGYCMFQDLFTKWIIGRGLEPGTPTPYALCLFETVSALPLELGMMGKGRGVSDSSPLPIICFIKRSKNI